MPTEIVSGLSVSFSLSVPNYPASSWGAILYLRSPSGSADITATADGDAFIFTASATDTASWPAETYSAVVRVTRADEVYQPVSQRLTVLPDIAGLSNHDPRTNAEKALAAVQATLMNRATKDQLRTAFGGRSLEKTPLADLLKLESRFLKQVNAERRKKAGKGFFTLHKVRMS